MGFYVVSYEGFKVQRSGLYRSINCSILRRNSPGLEKEAEKIFNGRFSSKFPQDIQQLAERKLIMIHRAGALNDLHVPPANRFEALKGKRKGQHSIRINDQWRICFEWHNDGVYQVEITDYH